MHYFILLNSLQHNRKYLVLIFKCGIIVWITSEIEYLWTLRLTLQKKCDTLLKIALMHYQNINTVARKSL